MTDIPAAPLELVRTEVQPEWIDEFGHVNVAHYVTICDLANWAFWNHVNTPHDMDARDGHEYAILENHVCYLDELALGEEIRVTTQLLSHDDKRIILFHRVWKVSNGALSATNEAKFLGFNLKTRGVQPWNAPVLATLADIQAAHDGLPAPDEAGQGIVLKKKR